MVSAWHVIYKVRVYIIVFKITRTSKPFDNNTPLNFLSNYIFYLDQLFHFNIENLEMNKLREERGSGRDLCHVVKLIGSVIPSHFSGI